MQPEPAALHIAAWTWTWWPYALTAALGVVAFLAAAKMARHVADRRRSAWRRRMAGLPGIVAAQGEELAGSLPMSGLSRDEALSHLRRIKAELKGRKGEGAVRATLAQVGLPALHDVILPDAHGLTQVDHLARLPGGIAVIETKAYGGVVTGTVSGRAWEQQLRDSRVRTSFQNPLWQNHRHVEAVRWHAGPGVPVRGVVATAGTARFCAELAGAVVSVDALAVRLTEGWEDGCDSAALDAAWCALTAAAAESSALREAHLADVRRRRAGARRDVGLYG